MNIRPQSMAARRKAPEASGPYADVSYWLASAGDDLAPRPAVKGDLTVDVAILGGGFSGLWTAYYLLRDNPGLTVAVIEREICGFGASGRNGGWCSSRFPLDASTLERRYGVETAQRVISTMYDTIEEVGRVCAAEGIDAEFRFTPILSVARGRRQLPAVQRTHQAFERLGFGDRNRLLSREETLERVRITDVSGALLSPVSATLHPAKLVRGLARVVERRGGVIFEQSDVTGVEPGQTPRLITPTGTITARKAVVAAGEAYLSQRPDYRRRLLPMSSLIILTEPLSTAQWDAIGWAGGEGLGSQVNIVDYFTKTSDGRILYGSRGAPYHWGSRMDDPWDPATAAQMRKALVEWFPSLDGIDFTHSWAGFLGVPRDWTPTVGFNPETKIGELFGYTGRGVSTTNLSARILAGKIMGRDSGVDFHPMINHRSPLWEREPLRWLGVRYIQGAFQRMDASARQGKADPIDAELARRLSRQ